MTNSRSAVFLVVLAFLWTSSGNADAQKVNVSSTSIKQQVLSLNFTKNGQRLAATVGQQIEITLGTVGGPQYGEPLVSSSTIRLESTALGWPPNPGGPSFTYIFEAVAEGEAQVTIPLIYSQDQDLTRRLTFTVTIRVGPATDGGSTAYASRTPDQANTASWTNAWTNLLNDVRQTFKPSLPRLTGVEVQLVVANPGAASDEVSMTLVNAAGEALAVVSKTVPVAECSHVLFLLPKGGARVLPGQVYGIELHADSGLFGWKYIVGGYEKGSVSFNSQPLLRDARSTFLFKTFGTK
jgi:hypothetical protein